ncbi:hypothetical protein HOLleu_40279 [Holothuria leucospilota]|uniref:Uncharacterized protein n=1 Tax=Holothuria leucospilota TaxID=206669 RepID=A0A9Q0YFJ9_HOLLE|nr:hypothetical protein HOLleu_40279 [Holothuria leucospilota]
MRSPEVREQNFQRIPKINIWGYQRSKKSKISQVFPRSSSGVTRGQKAKFAKNLQDPRSIGVESLSRHFLFPFLLYLVVFRGLVRSAEVKLLKHHKMM